jgi:hypothetical protein
MAKSRPDAPALRPVQKFVSSLNPERLHWVPEANPQSLDEILV